MSTHDAYGKVHNQHGPLPAATVHANNSRSRIGRTCRLCAEHQRRCRHVMKEELGAVGPLQRSSRSFRCETLFRTLLPSQARAARSSFPIATAKLPLLIYASQRPLVRSSCISAYQTTPTKNYHQEHTRSTLRTSSGDPPNYLYIQQAKTQAASQAY